LDLSANNQATTHSTGRPHLLVLAVAPLGHMAGSSGCRPAGDGHRIATQALRELGKLGIMVTKATVDKYRVRSGKAPSPTWKAFLKNHVSDLVSIDFLIVPSIPFKLLYVLIVLRHARRKVLHFNITENPTAWWTAQQIVEACPSDSTPKYLFRDRDASTVGSFESGFTPWASSKSSARREVLGKIHSSNGSLAHYDVTASTMWSRYPSGG
jgi:hypothetical protein